ncbi:unnamed protein product [Amoebophrya sp. A25]|nr:unnamed protein product [Amoebophrya sp. A25]|eukprot:GSA25T00019008001.1
MQMQLDFYDSGVCSRLLSLLKIRGTIFENMQDFFMLQKQNWSLNFFRPRPQEPSSECIATT